MKFQAGDIAILHSLTVMTQYNNQECGIIAVGPWNPGDTLPNGQKCFFGYDYQIMTSDKLQWYAKEANLRNSPPPEDTTDYIPASIRQLFNQPKVKDPGYTPEKPLRKKEPV